MQAGCVEAGQPHIAHDHELQRIIGVLDALSQQVAACLVTDVRLPVERIGGRTGHDHLEQPRLVVVGVPLRTQRDQGLVECDADPPAHADDHRLTVQGRDPVLEVPHQVGGHQREPLLSPHQGLHRGPLALQSLLLGVRVVLGQVLDFSIDQRLLVVRQRDPGQTAFVVDRHRGAVRDGAADVVDVDIVAEHRWGVDVVALDRGPGEADEGGVGQCVAQVFGEAVADLTGRAVQTRLETVLAAVRFVRDHHDIAPVAQQRIDRFPRGRRELVNGREDHPAGGAVQRLAQVLATGRLGRRLADQVRILREGAEQLVVQIVAVGDDQDGWVLQFQAAHQLPGIEDHQQALARALGMPDHPHPPIPAAVVLHSAQSIGLRVLIDARIDLGNGPHRGCHGELHRVELVIPGNDLDQAAAGVAEHDEGLEQVQEAAALADPLDQDREFRRRLRRDAAPIGGPPGHEAFRIRRQRADACAQPVGCHQDRIGAKQRGNLRLVGLELIEGGVQGRLLVPGVLEFDHHQRQAVDEQHHIGAPLNSVLDHRELGDCQPVVGVRVGEVHQAHPVAPDGAILCVELHPDPLDHELVQAAVLLDQRGRLARDYLHQGIVAGFGRNLRVEPLDGGPQAPQQQHVGIRLALGRAAVRADLGVAGAGVAQPLQLLQQGVLDVGLGDVGHSGGLAGAGVRDRSVAVRYGSPMHHNRALWLTTVGNLSQKDSCGSYMSIKPRSVLPRNSDHGP